MFFYMESDVSSPKRGTRVILSFPKSYHFPVVSVHAFNHDLPEGKICWLASWYFATEVDLRAFGSISELEPLIGNLGFDNSHTPEFR